LKSNNIERFTRFAFRYFGFVISGIILFWYFGCKSSEKSLAAPNLVVLYADDLGYGDLGCYGSPTISTPQLDRMAREGLRLTSFYVAPTCDPSRIALLTGRYPVRTGLQREWGGGVGSTNGIPEYEITLAEALKKQGYRTKMVGKWHLGYRETRYLPPNHGFDSWFGLPYSNDMQRPWVQTDVPLQLYRDTEPIEFPVDQSTLTTRYTEEASKFVQSAEEPFFLYLAYNMPHLPIHTTERFRNQSRGGLYGDVIETIDWSVGRLLETLQQRGIDERTLVLFSSDNGPWLNLPSRMLQSGNEPWHAGSPGPFRQAKATTYEGGVRVPCLIRWPGVIPGGRTSADIVANIDLFPTFVKLAGGEIPGDRTIDGMDLSAFIRGEKSSPRREHYYIRGGDHLEAVRKDAWKLRLSNAAREDRSADMPPEPELFHLDRDPSERYNVAARYPEKVDELKARLLQFVKETGARVEFD